MHVELFSIMTSAPAENIHQHDEWELCYCIEGSGECTLGGESAVFGKGSYYLCPPNVPHSRVSGEDKPKDLYLKISGDVPCHGMVRHIFTDDVDFTARAMLTVAYKLYNNGGYSERLALDLLVESLLTLIAGGAAQEHLSESVVILRDAIYKNFADPEFKIVNYIGNLGYNPDYMRRLFKAEMGVTPTELLTLKRIESAKTLLAARRTPELTVAEIAFISGFYDFNYFTRVFKKVTGTLPTAYRKASRK